MSDRLLIGDAASSLEVKKPYLPISKIVLWYDDSQYFEAGDNTGYVLEAPNPFATQEMADKLLSELKGIVYYPYEALDASLDPAFELGDAVIVHGTTGIVANAVLNSDGVADIAAPGEDETDSEYAYESQEQVNIDRSQLQMYSLIEKTSTEIRLYVADEIEQAQAEFEITAEQIYLYVEDQIEGVSSEVTQTANSLTAQIQAVDGRITTVTTDLSGVKAEVQDVSGKYASLTFDVDGLQITTSELYDSVDGLGDGTTRISGYCIQTGKIAAKYLEVEDIIASRIGSGSVELLNASGSRVGTMSISSSSSAMSGQGVNISAPAIGLNATSGDVFLSSRGNATYLHVNADDVTCKGGFRPIGSGAWNLGSSSNKWANVYATNGVIQTSDRNQKKDIMYGLDGYDELFDGLQVCTYRMLDGGQRKHPGLIAQDVEATMISVGLSDMDFAGLIKSPDGVGGYDYALRYGEFIPILIDQEQKSKKRIANLEARVKALEDVYA